MSNEKIRHLLDELAQEISSTDIDDDTADLLKKLDDDIQTQRKGLSVDEDELSPLEQAKELEVKFAVNHPAAERLMQEVIDILSKMGI